MLNNFSVTIACLFLFQSSLFASQKMSIEELNGSYVIEHAHSNADCYDYKGNDQAQIKVVDNSVYLSSNAFYQNFIDINAAAKKTDGEDFCHAYDTEQTIFDGTTLQHYDGRWECLVHSSTFATLKKNKDGSLQFKGEGFKTKGFFSDAVKISCRLRKVLE